MDARRREGITGELSWPSDFILGVRLAAICGGLTAPIDLDFCGGPAYYRKQ